MALYQIDAAVNLSAPDLAYSTEQADGLTPAYSAAGVQGAPMQRANVPDANFGGGDGLSLFPFYEAGEPSPVPGETSLRPRSDGAYSAPLAEMTVPTNGLVNAAGAFAVAERYHVPASATAALSEGQAHALWAVRLPEQYGFPSALRFQVRKVGGALVWSFRVGATNFDGAAVTTDAYTHTLVRLTPATGDVTVQVKPHGGALVADAVPGAAFAPGLAFDGGSYLQGEGLVTGGADAGGGATFPLAHLVSRAGLALYTTGRADGQEEPTEGDLTTLSADYADAAWVARNPNLQGAVFGDPEANVPADAPIRATVRVHRYSDLLTKPGAEVLADIANVTGGEGVHLNFCYDPADGQHPDADTDPATVAAAVVTALAQWVNAGITILSVGDMNEPDIFGTLTPAQAAAITNARLAAVRAAYPDLPQSVAEWGHSHGAALYEYLDALTEPYEIIAVHNYHRGPADFARDVAYLRTNYPGKQIAQTEGNINISLERLTPVTTPVNPGRWAWAGAVAVAAPLDLFASLGADAVPFWTYWAAGENPALVGGDLTATGLVTVDGEDKPHAHVMNWFAQMAARVLPVTASGRAAGILARDAAGTRLDCLLYQVSVLKASPGAGSRVRVAVDNLPDGMAVESAYRVDRNHASIFESGDAALVSEPELVSVDSDGFSAALAPGSLLLVSLAAADPGEQPGGTPFEQYVEVMSC